MDKRRLLEAEEQRRRAEEDKLAAIHELEHRSREVLLEKVRPILPSCHPAILALLAILPSCHPAILRYLPYLLSSAGAAIAACSLRVRLSSCRAALQLASLSASMRK